MFFMVLYFVRSFFAVTGPIDGKPSRMNCKRFESVILSFALREASVFFFFAMSEIKREVSFGSFVNITGILCSRDIERIRPLIAFSLIFDSLKSRSW